MTTSVADKSQLGADNKSQNLIITHPLNGCHIRVLLPNECLSQIEFSILYSSLGPEVPCLCLNHSQVALHETFEWKIEVIIDVALN